LPETERSRSSRAAPARAGCVEARRLRSCPREQSDARGDSASGCGGKLRATSLALMAATLAGATLLSSNPIAYTLSGPTWSQPQTPYYINTANLDLPVLSTETAVRAGADTWQLQSAAF